MNAYRGEIDGLSDKLTKLAQLRENGDLTEDEFRAVKARFLNSDDVSDRRPDRQLTSQSESGIVQSSEESAPSESLLGEGASTAAFLLVAINCGVFLLMLVDNPSAHWKPDFLLRWGADYGGLTLNDEPWRLITSTFVHLSFIHIAGNMGALLYWGRVTERALGSVLFLLVYFLCGLAASLVSVEVNPHIVSAGASGAIAGLLGVMCVMWLRGDSRVDAEDVFGNLAFNVALSFLAGVDWVAHVAGLTGGLILGALLLRSTKLQKA